MPSLTETLQQVTALDRGAELARLARDCLFEAADTSTTNLEPIAARRSADLNLSAEQASTPLGNVIEALSRTETNAESASLISALIARSLKDDPPQGVDAEDKVASRLAWIASSTKVDSLALLDAALGEKAEGLWGALADLVQRHDARSVGTRAEALVAAAALGTSTHPTARKRVAELLSQLTNPGLLRMLAVTGSDAPLQAEPLKGELARTPRGAVATFLLAACGWLLAANVGRVLGRLALKYKRPTEVLLTPRGVLIRGKTELLGKVLREHEQLIPLEGLIRATREVRYPNMGTYAGLTALALGSYFGVSWFVDGVRAASFSLIALGLLIILLGLGLDFALASLIPGKKGKCRVVFVPKKGTAVCLAQVDLKAADTTMAALAKR